MKAIRIERYGGPGELALAEVALPQPRAGEVRVKMHYAGVNFTDIYRREGRYAHSPTYRSGLPMVPGIEGAGTVDLVGEGGGDFVPGERVVFTRNLEGAYAEYCIVAATRLVRVPAALDLECAAAVLNQGITAQYLTAEFGLAAGGSCLVHAAAGGVGSLLVQFAKRRGATVFATVGSRDKAALARDCGADHVILYREADFCAEVRRLSGGRGVDIVYDTVGRDTFAGSLGALAVRGTLVLVGNASGPVESVDPMALAEAGSVSLVRPHMQHYVRTPEEYARRAREVLALAAEGVLRVTVDRVLPLAQAADAQRALAARETRGKILLAIGE